MGTYRLLIEYDGSDFNGWQVQPGQPTVQGALESALATVLDGSPRIVGSGRTDSGVHARGQVAHFQSDEAIDPFRLRRSLNGLTPHSVAVQVVEEAPSEFHARYDARERLYRYFVRTNPPALERNHRMHLRPTPDFALMNTAAEDLVQHTHFGAFCRTQSGTENRVCDVRAARWIEEERDGYWHFEVTADRFLHGMVRTIVGTLMEIGRHQRPLDDLPRVLASRDRREAGPAVDAHGLVLESVSYEPAWQPKLPHVTI